jgi:hypothetical protein
MCQNAGITCTQYYCMQTFIHVRIETELLPSQNYNILLAHIKDHRWITTMPTLFYYRNAMIKRGDSLKFTLARIQNWRRNIQKSLFLTAVRRLEDPPESCPPYVEAR